MGGVAAWVALARLAIALSGFFFLFLGKAFAFGAVAFFYSAVVHLRVSAFGTQTGRCAVALFILRFDARVALAGLAVAFRFRFHGRIRAGIALALRTVAFFLAGFLIRAFIAIANGAIARFRMLFRIWLADTIRLLRLFLCFLHIRV